jgi:ParB/RepB/Spo0J family partition protein
MTLGSASGGWFLRDVSTSPEHDERLVEIAELGEQLAAVRLCEPSALEAVRRSLARDGQLGPITVFESRERLEIIDGFKRRRAAQALGWRQLRARVLDVDTASAKVLVVALHGHRGLTEVEEGWLVRSLVRDDGLSQGAIAQRLGRHKSWVCRRLLLVEGLDTAVQADVRLGLLAPRAAIALGALPRGNQVAAAGLIVRRGLTVRQTELLVAELVDLGDDNARATEIARRAEAAPLMAGPAVRATRATRSEAEWITSDVLTIRRVAARLEARLIATPLGAFGAPATEVIFAGLVGLLPVITALGRTVAVVTGKERAA